LSRSCQREATARSTIGGKESHRTLCSSRVNTSNDDVHSLGFVRVLWCVTPRTAKRPSLSTNPLPLHLLSLKPGSNFHRQPASLGDPHSGGPNTCAVVYQLYKISRLLVVRTQLLSTHTMRPSAMCAIEALMVALATEEYGEGCGVQTPVAKSTLWKPLMQPRPLR